MSPVTSNAAWMFLIASGGSSALLARCLDSVLLATSGINAQVVIGCDHMGDSAVMEHIALLAPGTHRDRSRAAFVPTAQMQGFPSW